MHRLKRNDELPGNESTKQLLIEDAREAHEENQNKPYKSFLLPLISSMVSSFVRRPITEPSARSVKIRLRTLSRISSFTFITVRRGKRGR